MASNLELAERIEKQSREEARILEELQVSVFNELKKSLLKQIKENENTIKSATIDFRKDREELQRQLTQHLQSIKELIDLTFSQFRTHTQQRLSSEKEEIEQKLKNHKEEVTSFIESNTLEINEVLIQREERITNLIKEQMKPFLIVSSIVIFCLMLLSALIGGWIAKKAMQPQPYIYKIDSRTGKSYLIPAVVKD